MATTEHENTKKQDRRAQAEWQPETPAPQPAQSAMQQAAVQRRSARRAAVDINSASPEAVKQLQRMVGNQMVARMVADSRQARPPAAQRSIVRVQAKLTVGPVGDRYEREADQIASQVMRMKTPVQRPQDKEEQQGVQRTPEIQRSSPAADQGSFDVDKGWEQRLNSSKGKGQPLPDSTRSFMESRFKSDFGKVRVHSGGDSVQMSKEINAQAFTRGSDIHFAAGKYNPHSSGGQKLLAHELTHVVQQGGAVQRREEIRRCAKCDKDNVLRAPTKSAR
jgi:hypothetical protein